MKNWMWTGRITATMLVVLGTTAGCGGTKDGPRVARNFLAPTPTDIDDRVMGFESPLTDWTILNNAPGTIGSSTTASQGVTALSLQLHGYVPIQSQALSSLGSRVGTALEVDVQFQGIQTNPWWWGTMTLGVDIASLGVQSTQNGLIVNSFDLTGKLSSGWNTLSFDIPAALQTLLAGSYSDLQFMITLNVQSDTTGTYLIDNLRFLGGTPPSTPPSTGTDAGIDGGGQVCAIASPTGLVATPDDGVVELVWTASAGATSYKVVRMDSGGSSVTFPTTDASYADASVINGTAYSYAVVAVAACGESASSSGATATPTAPTKITLSFPKGVNRDSVVLAANGHLKINDRDNMLEHRTG